MCEGIGTQTVESEKVRGRSWLCHRFGSPRITNIAERGPALFREAASAADACTTLAAGSAYFMEVRLSHVYLYRSRLASSAFWLHPCFLQGQPKHAAASQKPELYPRSLLALLQRHRL